MRKYMYLASGYMSIQCSIHEKFRMYRYLNMLEMRNERLLYKLPNLEGATAPLGMRPRVNAGCIQGTRLHPSTWPM